MEIIPGWLNIDEKHMVPALQEAVAKLDNTEGETVLDLGSVSRINSSALRALEDFVGVADNKGIKVVLRGVNVNVYKVLKLAKLAHRVSFTN